jgi:hypothetical protein
MAILAGGNITENYTALTEGNTPQVGDVYFTPGGKVYKFVQYVGGAGAVAAVAGNVAYYFAPSGVSAGSETVTSDLSDSAGLGAGVLMSAIPINSYGWVQIKGTATITPALTAGADGNALTAVGATDGTLDVSALVTDAVVAYAIDASAKIIKCDFPF